MANNKSDYTSEWIAIAYANNTDESLFFCQQFVHKYFSVEIINSL